jgi:hypothetical protein
MTYALVSEMTLSVLPVSSLVDKFKEYLSPEVMAINNSVASSIL